jgi:hypothetical protein
MNLPPPPQVPQWGLFGERCLFPEPSFTHTLKRIKFHLSLQVPGKWAPLHAPSNGDPLETDTVSKANGWFIHLYLSESPVKELSYKTGGKHTVTVHWALGGRNAYIQWGAAWFPKRIVCDTAITTPVPCSLQHETFHLSLSRSEPN